MASKRKSPHPTPSRRARLLSAGGVFLLAFCVRSLYAVELAPLMYSHRQPGTRMSGRYDETATSILGGQGILYPRQRPEPSDTGLLARPPGYALWIAGIYAALGRSFLAVQFVQNLANALAAVLALFLGARLVGWAAGLVGGVLVALSPHLAFASNLVLPDALCALPVLAAILVLARADPARGDASRLRVWHGAAAGALVGVATWLRPNVMLLAPFLALALVAIFAPRRRALGPAAALAAAGLLAIAPITIRNWILYREFVPVSINGGITLWQGVAAAGGQRFGARPRDKLVIDEEAAYYGNPRYAEWWASPDGIARDRDRYRRAMDVILRHPLWYARAMGGRMVEMVSYARLASLAVAPSSENLPGRPTETARVEETAAADGPPDDPPAGALRPVVRDEAWLAPGRALAAIRPVVRALQLATTWAMLPLVLAGVAVVMAKSRRAGLLLLAVPLYYLLMESMFILEWRVAVPMHPYLFIFAGSALALGPKFAASLRPRLRPTPRRE